MPADRSRCLLDLDGELLAQLAQVAIEGVPAREVDLRPRLDSQGLSSSVGHDDLFRSALEVILDGRSPTTGTCVGFRTGPSASRSKNSGCRIRYSPTAWGRSVFWNVPGRLVPVDVG